MTQGSERAQVEAARTVVLAIRAPDLATLIVTGNDRVSWLNGLVTCDLAKIDSGEARYGLIVVRNGRVLTDTTVLLDADRAILVVPSRTAEETRVHLEHYLVMEDAEIAAGTDAFEVWMVHGPGTPGILRAARAGRLAAGTLDRLGVGGGVVLVGGDSDRRILHQAIADARGTVGDDAGWEALRLERGIPRFGVDFDDNTYPQEASLEEVAVSFDKGCYLGQEVVCMLQMRGRVKRKLVPVVIDDDAAPEPRAEVTDEGGAVVGEITSAVRSPTLGKGVALAMLKRNKTEPGQLLVVGGSRAQVVKVPVTFDGGTPLV